MAILFVKRMKMVLFAGVMLFSVPSYSQAYIDAIDKAQVQALEVNRVKAEIDVLEMEVDIYEKTIRRNERIEEKMSDKADRLKYKVMRELFDIDTTVARKMTYKEWQLEKTVKERDRAALQVERAEMNRQERILSLGDKTKELEEARMRLYNNPYAQEPARKSKKAKQKTRQPKEQSGKEAQLRG